jgi:predicted ester cyclase
MSQQDKNRDLVVDIYRQFELGNLERAKASVAPNIRCYIAGQVLERDHWIGFGAAFMEAFPDLRHVWEVAEGAGDYVLLNGYFTGTHQAPFMGIPATGKTVKVSATMVDKVIDGKMVEHRGDFDTAGLMQQLGGPEAANRALVEQFLAAFDAQDDAGLLARVSPSAKVRVGSLLTDRDGWMAMGKGFYNGFPDARFAIDEVVAAGDRVVVHAHWGGTHRGEFQGVPATGRKVAITTIMSFRIADGVIVEHHGELDSAGMMQQLSQ